MECLIVSTPINPFADFPTTDFFNNKHIFCTKNGHARVLSKMCISLKEIGDFGSPKGSLGVDPNVPRMSQAHQHNHKGVTKGGGGPKKVPRRSQEGPKHINTIIGVSQRGVGVQGGSQDGPKKVPSTSAQSSS